MRPENIQLLEPMSATCKKAGLPAIFLGLTIIIIEIMYRELSNVQVGIFVFLIGYALVKISQKITRILTAEKENLLVTKENLEALESLSLYCYFCGLIPIFLGILIVFMDIVNENYIHTIVGVFMFASGYAFVKISSKITICLLLEKGEDKGNSDQSASYKIQEPSYKDLPKVDFLKSIAIKNTFSSLLNALKGDIIL